MGLNRKETKNYNNYLGEVKFGFNGEYNLLESKDNKQGIYLKSGIFHQSSFAMIRSKEKTFIGTPRISKEQSVHSVGFSAGGGFYYSLKKFPAIYSEYKIGKTKKGDFELGGMQMTLGIQL